MILFYYRSQLKIWFGLYPILIYKIIFNNYGNLQIFKKISSKNLMKKTCGMKKETLLLLTE